GMTGSRCFVAPARGAAPGAPFGFWRPRGGARTAPRPALLRIPPGVLCTFLSAFVLAGIYCSATAAETNAGKPTVIVMAGASGEEDFGKVFVEAAQCWRSAAEKADVNFVGIGITNSAATNDLQLFHAALATEPENST